MAYLKMNVFVPVKVMSLTILSVIFLFSMKAGVCLKQTGTCRPFCAGNNCITVNQDRVDFKTAEETCHDRNGELMTFQSETDDSILDILSQEFFGNFWIGLRLLPGACSNLSAPLRGYEWTSVGMHRNFMPSFSTWKDTIKVCSPRCVSFSNDHKWMERLCSDKSDGFLCKTNHKDACQAQEISVFQSSKGCSDGPCEHICKDVKGGYICSCFKGYIPDSKDARQCTMHCAEEKCPAICDADDMCFCPEGFIRNANFCEDIDECVMNACDQECKNTIGGFLCSCQEGFILKDQDRCISVEDENFVITTPHKGFMKPTAKNTTLKGSSASAGSFILLWIFIAVAVIVLICVVWFYVVKRQKRREQSSNLGSPAPVDNIEC